MTKERWQTELSIIVPLFNEEESVEPLYNAITSALAEIGCSYELVFVEDGSRDDTYAVAADLARADPRLRVVKFSRNCGQTPAMAAGIDYARGRVLITMDGDLQNDPRDIPQFLAKIDEGFDVVVGWRQNRQDKLLTRKIPSKIANRLIGTVTGVPIRDNGCSLKAFRAELIKKIPLYSEMHRFIPAMTSLAGARIAEIPVRHHARRYGASKYGLSRVYKVLLDLLAIKTIVSFSSKPLVWFSLLAAPVFMLSAGLTFAGIYELFAGDGRLVLSLAGSGALYGALGIFLVFGGALGELIYRTGDIRLGELSQLTSVRVDTGESEATAMPRPQES